jgi:hypothetical protein
METIQLQLNKKIAALSFELPFENMALRFLCGAVCVLILAYLYFVSASVLNVIAQREAEHASASLQSKLGSLESAFFILTEKVTLAHASEVGLKPLTQQSFVYRSGDVGVIAGAHNAI